MEEARGAGDNSSSALDRLCFTGGDMKEADRYRCLQTEGQAAILKDHTHFIGDENEAHTSKGTGLLI